MADTDRAAAERRVHRILAFRDECDALRREGHLPVGDEALAAIAAYHDGLLASLTREHDVDASEATGRLSWGMRVASFLGAVALTASAYAGVSRYWGRLDEFWQVLLLAALPVAALAGVEISARRERTLHVAGLFALAAFGCIWLAIIGVARVVDVVPAPPVLWLGTLAAFALAAGYGFRIVFGGAVLALILSMAASLAWVAGTDWRVGLERLEPVAMSALAVLLMGRGLEQSGPGFGAVSRAASATVLLAALLLLSSSAGLSHLTLAPWIVETGYQAVFVLVSLTIIVVGLLRRRPELVTPAATLFTIFLLVRLVDWFWEAVPAWAFFLMLAGLAFGGIALLRRLRARLAGAWG
jgi:hypothetical protein